MENYKKIVKQTMKRLDKIRPSWEADRPWTRDLLNYKLGSNFVLSVIHPPTISAMTSEKKIAFYYKIFVYACKKTALNPEKIHLDGATIPIAITDPDDKITHQEQLDFAWWSELQTRLICKDLLNPRSIKAINKKKKALEKELKHGNKAWVIPRPFFEKNILLAYNHF